MYTQDMDLPDSFWPYLLGGGGIGVALLKYLSDRANIAKNERTEHNARLDERIKILERSQTVLEKENKVLTAGLAASREKDKAQDAKIKELEEKLDEKDKVIEHQERLIRRFRIELRKAKNQGYEVIEPVTLDIEDPISLAFLDDLVEDSESNG